MTRRAQEVNFDGIVGPTHNYAGLSYGNIASQRHLGVTSRPKQAALQGLEKMKLLADLGMKQAVLPPHDRPHMAALRSMGFTGSDEQIIEQAHRNKPQLLATCYSASSMWVANAATVSPSADTADGRVHLTPANLLSQPHRALEPPTTTAIMQAIFHDKAHFAVHDPLPADAPLADEGAANHTRLCPAYGEPGIELFTFGRAAVVSRNEQGPTTYPARQTRQASEAIARLHQLDLAHTMFIQQNPAAIDAGVFHNDVIAVGNMNVLLCHGAAFAGGTKDIDAIRRCYSEACGDELMVIQVREDEVPLADAVNSYLFNSQLITLPDGSMSLICPEECTQIESTRQWLQSAIVNRQSAINSVHRVELRQSMQNGGGPACLRLRIVLNSDELAAIHQGVIFNTALYETLRHWVEHHYRDELTPNDLSDPKLMTESRTALDELTQILQVGSIYSFQTNSVAK